MTLSLERTEIAVGHISSGFSLETKGMRQMDGVDETVEVAKEWRAAAVIKLSGCRQVPLKTQWRATWSLSRPFGCYLILAVGKQAGILRI